MSKIISVKKMCAKFQLNFSIGLRVIFNITIKNSFEERKREIGQEKGGGGGEKKLQILSENILTECFTLYQFDFC